MPLYITTKSQVEISAEMRAVVKEISKEEFTERVVQASYAPERILEDCTILSYRFDVMLDSGEFVSQFFKTDVKMNKTALIVPTRAKVSRATQKIEIPYAGEPLGGLAKNAVRDAAKKHANYRLPVDNDGVNGSTDDGKEIPIDTLGKWLFGTPGYRGHILVEGHREGVITCYVPNDAPQEALEMLKSISINP